MSTGDFTLPGEAGYEELTLRLARQWGADAIRDCDGTRLSPELIGAGYSVYSTICLIRSVNEWAGAHPEMLQQTLLMSFPVLAEGNNVAIDLLAGYSRDQFRVNDVDGMEFWQVWDRSTGDEVSKARWSYADGTVQIGDAMPYHQYTVNFFAFRLWEVISMYNHLTNGWGDRERLMPVEPWYPEVQEVIIGWLSRWCAEHPGTDIVRFTSMFYNFAWIWSNSPDARDVYSDWGSYDFSVNPAAMRAFREETGLMIQSEDFIRGGLRNATHNAPSFLYRQWIAFVHRFVAAFGSKCVAVAHQYGKKAYVFYDDSWIGVEPYGDRFADFCFDGIIKCAFSGFEARLCADVPHVGIREIRLHPYLFPTGLKGEPTFAPGGKPTPDLWRYWVHIRRALLRKPVDRIGLGGYLHLVAPFQDFVDAVTRISNDFRLLKALHANKGPKALRGKVGVLTAWGKLRTWSTSGHLHEHPEVDLLNALEALSGLPVNVEFLSLNDLLLKGVPADVSVLLNAGWPGSAWSGGEAWLDPAIARLITEWVMGGGGLIGIHAPAVTNASNSPALGHLFGIGYDDGSRKCMRKYPIVVAEQHFITQDGIEGLVPLGSAYLDALDTTVLAALDTSPMLSVRKAGKGRAIYVSGYRFTLQSARLIARAVGYAAQEENRLTALMCESPSAECAVFDGYVAVVSHSDKPTQTMVPGIQAEVRLEPYEQRIIRV